MSAPGALTGWLARLRAATPRALACTAAATAAYAASHWLLGHPQPVFAAIVALICLAPGVADHIRQSFFVLTGVTIGIVIGELALLLPGNIWELRLGISIFLSTVIGAAVTAVPIVGIQAGASALLVQLLGPEYAGLTRLLDVLVGLVVSLPFGFAVLWLEGMLKSRSD